jgi:hypothetical protein
MYCSVFDVVRWERQVNGRYGFAGYFTFVLLAHAEPFFVYKVAGDYQVPANSLGPSNSGPESWLEFINAPLKPQN